MSDIGAQSPSNEHIDRLAGILLTYNFYEKELGAYVYRATFLTLITRTVHRLRAGDVRFMCSYICGHGS
jgi:hypothetical protein